MDYYDRDISVQRCVPQLLINYNNLDNSPLIQTLQSSIYAQNLQYLSDLQNREQVCLGAAISALPAQPAAPTLSSCFTAAFDVPTLQARYGKKLDYACHVISSPSALSPTAVSPFGLSASGQICCTGVFDSRPNPGSTSCPAASKYTAPYLLPPKPVRYCPTPATACRVFSCSTTSGTTTTTVYVSGCVSASLSAANSAPQAPYGFVNEALASLVEASPEAGVSASALAYLYNNSGQTLLAAALQTSSLPTCSGAWRLAGASAGRAMAWVAAAAAAVVLAGSGRR